MKKSALRALFLCLLAANLSCVQATDLTHLGQPVSEFVTVLYQTHNPTVDNVFPSADDQLRIFPDGHTARFQIPANHVFVITDVDWHLEMKMGSSRTAGSGDAVALALTARGPRGSAHVIYSSSPSPLYIGPSANWSRRHPHYHIQAGGHDSLTAGVVMTQDASLWFHLVGNPLVRSPHYVRDGCYVVLHGYFMAAPRMVTIQGPIPGPGGAVTGPGGTGVTVPGVPGP